MFALRLALHTGRLDVDKMLASMSCEQFIEWMAYDSVTPFGQDHTDFLLAQINADMATWMSRKPVKPTEKLPRYKAQPPTFEEVVERLRRGRTGG